MDTPTALALRLAGLGSISTTTFQNVHEQCQNQAEKFAEREPFAYNVQRRCTPKGDWCQSISGNATAQASKSIGVAKTGRAEIPMWESSL
jgi:hypothetical protein